MSACLQQAHVCISNTSRAGAELGYDVSVLADGIGDRDIPGASARQLVEVCFACVYPFFFFGLFYLAFFLGADGSCVLFGRVIDYAGGTG